MEVEKSCPERVIEHFGGMSATVRALLVDRQTVYKWKEQGYIPPNNALLVEQAVNKTVTIREMLEEANKKNPPKSSLRNLVQRG